MAAYLFRRIRDNASDAPSEIGIAVADSLGELFWTLDEFGNPHDFEYCEAIPGDALHAWQVPDEQEEDCFASVCGPEYVWPTMSETAMFQDERGWRVFESPGEHY